MLDQVFRRGSIRDTRARNARGQRCQLSTTDNARCQHQSHPLSSKRLLGLLAAGVGPAISGMPSRSQLPRRGAEPLAEAEVGAEAILVAVFLAAWAAVGATG